jgi:hypothetical protein
VDSLKRILAWHCIEIRFGGGSDGEAGQCVRERNGRCQILNQTNRKPFMGKTTP